MRFFCPAVVSPDKFHLTNKDVPPEARKVLLVVSKTMIQLANEAEFSDPHMQPLNNFINDQQMLVVDWLVRFATRSMDLGEGEGGLGSGDNIEVTKVSKESREASFEYIRYCLYHYRDQIFSVLVRAVLKED